MVPEADVFMIWEQGGAKMRYEIYGGGKPALLLLHGWGCDLTEFSPIIRDFQDKMTIVAVDFPGHGQSPEPPSPWSVTDYAQCLISLLDDLSLGPVHCLAHSFGGRVLLWAASHRADLFAKLIITGGAGLPPKDSGTLSFRTRLYKVLNRAAGLLPGSLRGKAREALVQRFGSADYKALTPSMRETFKRVIHQDLTDTLPSVRSSTLLYWGETDTATPLWMGQTMEKAIPDAGLVVESGVGHYAFLERYGHFKAVMENFLEVDA